MSDRSQYSQTVISDMDAAGTRLNMQYYNSDQVKINSVQVDSLKKYKQSLTTTTFSSTSQIIIPSSDSISDTYLYLELPKITNPNTVLAEGWGFDAIRSVNYTIGASSISTVELSSESLFSHAMLCCETSEKRSKMLKLAGTAVTVGSDRDIAPKAVLILSTPWSTIRKSLKLGYDASLLSDPIILQVTFNDANHFMSTATGGTVAYPNAFTRAECILKQGVLTDKSDSMRKTLQANSNLMVSYPFIHKQTGTNTYLTNVAAGDVVEVPIQSMINSDFLGLSCMVVPSRYKKSGVAGVMANKRSTLECHDLQLLYNGQIYADLPWKLAELAVLNLDQGSSTCPKSLINSSGASVTDGEYFIYYLPFSYLKSVIFETENGYANVSRYAQQTMTLRFAPQNTVTESLDFTCTYYYNALLTSQQGGSRITFA